MPYSAEHTTDEFFVCSAWYYTYLISIYVTKGKVLKSRLCLFISLVFSIDIFLVSPNSMAETCIIIYFYSVHSMHSLTSVYIGNHAAAENCLGGNVTQCKYALVPDNQCILLYK